MQVVAQEEENEHKLLVEKTLKEKGEDWLIAALVDGSIGYYSPHSAMLRVKEYKRGQTENHCERGVCCFGADLLLEITHDIRYFSAREEHNSEGIKRLVEYVSKTKEIDSFEFTSTFSMMYPTSRL